MVPILVQQQSVGRNDSRERAAATPATNRDRTDRGRPGRWDGVCLERSPGIRYVGGEEDRYRRSGGICGWTCRSIVGTPGSGAGSPYRDDGDGRYADALTRK